MKSNIFSNKDLFEPKDQRSFPGTASEAAFLLGGIGTGNVSLGARGELRDWEIFNRPGKGVRLHYSFFAIWVKEEGKEPICKVLESKLSPPFSQSHGFRSGEIAGLPRFEKSTLKGEYPIVWITLEDEDMPVTVTLEAYTPMIPLNTDDSSIPCAIFNFQVKNKTKNRIQVSIVGSLLNAVDYNGLDSFANLRNDCFKGNVNEYRLSQEFSGLYMYSTKLKENDLKFGSMTLATTSKNITYKVCWKSENWCDGIQDMWDDFSSDGEFDIATSNIRIEDGRPVVGSISANDILLPYSEKEFQFLLAWHFPNRINGWNQSCCGTDCSCTITQNYYTNLFSNSWDVIKYVIGNYKRLSEDTYKFHKTLFESTLPSYVLDAATSNMDILRSTTCFRLKNGKFFAYEGCFDGAGCCEGNCTHVWNYEQTLAFLYPVLERDMRITEFNVETKDSGKMEFRTNKLFGDSNNYHPAADGQLGCIIRLYRDWKLCGSNEFLASVWDNAKRALDFAFTYWDSDGDCVLDSQQHNTYDIEFYGPNSLVNSMFYGALKAGAEMATAMGDAESASKYEKALAIGSEKMDRILWDKEYYVQVIEDVNKYKYQYGKGCLSDQLLGQLLSHIAGLGYILPEEHVKKAVNSIFKYNFFTDFSSHNNVQRTYALNDEKGLVLCSWPNGGRPKLPFVYSDEVWTGIEYQVATHLIYEGFINEGLTIVKAVRDRHDGFRRNPWNEVECGHHYARAMSSWSLLIALSGYKFDLVKGLIEFNPVVNKDDFSCFFSCGKAWGVFKQKLDTASMKYNYKVEVLYGDLNGISIKANGEDVL